METKFISVGNQKGGVGKSTITSVLANYLHNNTDKKICIVDADDLQQTLMGFRDTDLSKYINDIPELKERYLKENHSSIRQFVGILEAEENTQLDTFSEHTYEIVPVKSSMFPKLALDLVGHYDLVFVDLPGNLKQEGVVECYDWFDYIFIPSGTSQADLESSIKFIEVYKELCLPQRRAKGKETGIYSFLNRVKSNTTEFKAFMEDKEVFPVPVLNSYFPDSIIFQREASTVNDYQFEQKEKNVVESFCKEILSIINV